MIVVVVRVWSIGDRRVVRIMHGTENRGHCCWYKHEFGRAERIVSIGGPHEL